MTELLTNNAATTVASGLNNTTNPVTFAVASAAAFPATGNFRILVGTELLLVTARSGNNFTAQRGIEGTANATHANGVAVTHVLTADGLQQVIQEQGGTTVVSAAVGDGTTNNTTVINAEITALSAAGGGVLAFRPGIYMASQIIVKRFVLLDGGHAGAVKLRQIAGTNTDFVISENFASCTGQSGPSVDCPVQLGLQDITIDGNRDGGNTSGRGVALCAAAIRFAGHVIVMNAAQTNLYTERPNSYLLNGSPGIPVEGWFDTVSSFDWGAGHGWDYVGPGDGVIYNYTGVSGPNSTPHSSGGYAFLSRQTATSYGGIDYFAFCHVYSEGASVLSPPGIRFDVPTYVQTIYPDGCPVIIGASSMVGSIYATLVGFRNGFDGLTVTSAAGYTIVGGVFLSMEATANGWKAVNWEGTRGYLGRLVAHGNGCLNGTGLRCAGDALDAPSVYVETFTGTGSKAIDVQDTYSEISGTCFNNLVGLNYAGGGHTTLRLDLAVFGGQVPVSGSAPAVTDRFDVRESILAEAGTDVRVVAAAAVSMTVTTVQTITIPHTCLYTPTMRNIQLTFGTTRTDYAWDIVPQVDPTLITATNVIVKCKLRTASASGTGDIALAIRLGA